MSIVGQQNINIGLPNESAGSDSLYTAFTKAQQNFTTLFSCASPYSSFLSGNGVLVNANASTGTVTFNNSGVTNIIAGTNIVIDHSNGNVTISSTGGGGSGGGGTVTSVGINPGPGITVLNSPIVASGNMTVGLASSGVVANTYVYPTLTVDIYGRITSAVNGNLAGNISNVNTVSKYIGNVNIVAGNISNVNNVGGNIANIDAVNTNIPIINVVGGNIGNVNLVGGNIANVGAVAGNIGNVNTVGGNIANVNTVASGKVLPRVVNLTDSNSITINCDTTDLASQVNTQAQDTLTINAPTGTPGDGQRLVLRIKSANTQTISWDPSTSKFTGSLDIALPTNPGITGSNKIDYFCFMWNSLVNKWNMISMNRGF